MQMNVQTISANKFIKVTGYIVNKETYFFLLHTATKK